MGEDEGFWAPGMEELLSAEGPLEDRRGIGGTGHVMEIQSMTTITYLPYRFTAHKRCTKCRKQKKAQLNKCTS